MRNFLLLITLGTLLFSCQKTISPETGTTPPVTPPTTTSQLASVINSNSQNNDVTLDSFVYNSNSTLARFISVEAGTSGAGVYVANFTYAANSLVPASYVDSLNGSVNRVHQLYYDAQNRLIKDTATDGSGFVTYFSYPGNLIVAYTLFDGTTTDDQVDTATLTNGNITAMDVVYPTATVDDNGYIKYAYTSYANPGYNANTANSIGPLLFFLTYDGFGGYEDYISKNIVGNGTVTQAGASYTFTHTFTFDTGGRVTGMTRSFGSTYTSQFTFRYY